MVRITLDDVLKSFRCKCIAEFEGLYGAVVSCDWNNQKAPEIRVFC